MAARKDHVPPTTEPKLRLSQIVVNVVLLDEYDAPVDAPGGPFVFRNTSDGQAAQHLIGWLAQHFMDAPAEDAKEVEERDAAESSA